ncbi:succinate dehydrogenase subunit D [Ferrimonas balearica DSM 9799]|uniref:Succinate dehydrogenase hydrophobic membrane anchor subunit n=1 Tax=Ferrimonas balearica (strain DSM 9799 / CCM 4581 / KCTC 23876 / PAT) TaxID=550540 RepID=E1SNL9_FERBD|nr:succinate dehydrogenase, hydrophobic membrane anchor protein [Ferrimonas balearica]MBY6018490.1 succinate dehydrogenase, hydrophobic membrane anchor protein [Halomonas denitrificans]ADN76692.1 succinate dehydrogenase subunit D [Ferrimonas balearica DSM 9799]MBW3140321.1 succinate dehydrogenase, hydrophobic membrane anchor protein [Ferrimonas balearica]MBW3166336.1 succinate dehydrogenase, hydrophobic membrane anchor protein [Ferrimonas balearica]MBY5979795.1 succinate dehydrogenase, hydroph
MVKNAATLGRSGVHDFVLLRASALVLASFVLFMVGFLALTPELTFESWHGLFSHTAMKVYTLVSLVALLVHGWIGLWQVLTDYIKPAGLRAFLQFAVNLVLLAYLFAGVVILWGV